MLWKLGESAEIPKEGMRKCFVEKAELDFKDVWDLDLRNEGKGIPGKKKEKKRQHGKSTSSF